MSEKRSRLQRKAARLARTRQETEHNSAMNKLRAARDADLARVNEEFRQEIKRLEEARVETRKEIWAKYDAQREDLIMASARAETAAA